MMWTQQMKFEMTVHMRSTLNADFTASYTTNVMQTVVLATEVLSV